MKRYIYVSWTDEGAKDLEATTREEALTEAPDSICIEEYQLQRIGDEPHQTAYYETTFWQERPFPERRSGWDDTRMYDDVGDAFHP